MCQRIECSDCGKPSFAGCGRHIESVLGDVPTSERCRCRATSASPPAPADGAAGGLKRFLGLLGAGRERRRP
jgi:hypothetical protein